MDNAVTRWLSCSAGLCRVSRWTRLPHCSLFHPPERNWHLTQPIVFVTLTVANQNRDNGNERRDLRCVGWGRPVLRCRNGAVPPITPSPSGDAKEGLFPSLLQWEGEHVNVTASLEVIWFTGRHDVIKHLITEELFSIDLSNVMSRTTQHFNVTHYCVGGQNNEVKMRHGLMVRNILFILKMRKRIEVLNTTQMQVYRQSFCEYLLITSRVTVRSCSPL